MTEKAFNKTLVLSALSLPQPVENVSAAPQAGRASTRRTTHGCYQRGRALAIGIGAALLGIATITWTHELKMATAHAARPNAVIVPGVPANTGADFRTAAPAEAVEESERPAVVVHALAAVVIRARTSPSSKRAPRPVRRAAARPATGFARISAADVAAQ